MACSGGVRSECMARVSADEVTDRLWLYPPPLLPAITAELQRSGLPRDLRMRTLQHSIFGCQLPSIVASAKSGCCESYKEHTNTLSGAEQVVHLTTFGLWRVNCHLSAWNGASPDEVLCCSFRLLYEPRVTFSRSQIHFKTIIADRSDRAV
jgi:hypothetical protein